MKKILIAEDTETVRIIISNTLRDAGYEVIEATDGDEP